MRKCTGREPARRAHPIPPLLFRNINYVTKSKERTHSVASTMCASSNELNILSPSHLTACVSSKNVDIPCHTPPFLLLSIHDVKHMSHHSFQPSEACLKFERPGRRQHLGSEPSILSPAKEDFSFVQQPLRLYLG